MIGMKPALALLALALTGAAAEPWDWGDTNEDWTNSPNYESSKALCRQLKGREPPASDAPDAAAAASLKDCDSEKLYYGIGMKADPVRARQCAFLEAKREEQMAGLYGRAMLMTIYANGVGAKRDYDVAIHLACGVDGAPMESHGRVTHLAELREGKSEATDFHFCDDITSGYAGGLCAAHFASIRDVKRADRLAALTSGWSAAQLGALAKLKKAQDAFAEAHADGEVDMSGTLRSAFWIQAQEALDDEFLEMLATLESGRPPLFTRTQVQESEAALNATYRKTLAVIGSEGFGTVTAEGVRTAQRAWIPYRDAFLAFARAKYPAVRPDSLRAWLNTQRTKMLKLDD